MAVVLLVALVTVAAGGLLARGATETLLTRLVEGYFGEEDGFDLLVQIQAADVETGRQALAELLARELPGTRIKVGPALGGQQNYFLVIPRERKTARDLGRLDALFARLPGFSGYTVLMHPVVTVSRVHPAFRLELQEVASSLPGVKLSFWHGNDLVLLLESPEGSTGVVSRLQRLLQQIQIYRLELPVPLSAGELSRLAAGVAGRLNADEGYEGAQFYYQPLVLPESDPAGGAGDLQQALQAVRDLLQLYVTRVGVRFFETASLHSGDQVLLAPADPEDGGAKAAWSNGPLSDAQPAAVLAQITEIGNDGRNGRALVIKGQWNGGKVARVFAWEDGRVGEQIGSATVDSPRLELIAALARTEQLLASAQSSGQELPQVLEDLETALRGVERLLDRVAILFHSSSAAQKDQLLFTLALNVLAEQLGLTGDGNNQAAAGLDRDHLTRLRKGIEKLRQQSELADPSRLAPLIADLKELRASLHSLNDGRLGAGLLGLEQYLQANTSAGNRLEWRGPAGLSEERLRAAIAAELASAAGVKALPASARITNLPAGLIQPDARTQLLTLVRTAGRLVNFLFVGVLTLLVLLFDQATVIATWKAVRRAKQRYAPVSRSRERLVAYWRWAADRLGPLIYGASTGALLAGGGSWVGLVLSAGGREGAVAAPLGAVAEAAGAVANLGAVRLPVLVGALFGLLVAAAAERLSPVAEEQVWAGESLGLSYGQIMEEIVIPAGRPGLYQLLLAFYRTLFRRGTGPSSDKRSKKKAGGEGEAWRVLWYPG